MLGGQKKLMREIDNLVAGLTIISNKLNRRIQHMSNKSKELFNSCVKAQMEGDRERALTYASELTQLRKVLNSMVRTQLSIEATTNRLRTVRDFKDVKDALLPVRELLGKLGKDVHTIIPEAGSGVRNLQDVLEDVVMGMGIVHEPTYVAPSIDDEEVAKILKEAAGVAARKTKDALPDVDFER